MSNLYQRFTEDRRMRDAAKMVFIADAKHARASLSGKGVAERIGGRISVGAKDVFETAKSASQDNLGIIAALIGAVLLWFSRGPILELLGLSEDEGQPGEYDDDEWADERGDNFERAGDPERAEEN